MRFVRRFSPGGAKNGAQREEKYRSAEGLNTDRVTRDAQSVI
jgi:hypothetical protein